MDETLKDFFTAKLQEFDDRHTIDFGEGDLTDKEMVVFLSALVRNRYKEDRAWLVKLFGL